MFENVVLRPHFQYILLEAKNRCLHKVNKYESYIFRIKNSIINH